jgi:3'-phosphoadenosine 5'-phosphosulfate sulfotransferase (PAPS reductase)/FAD synthetase
MKDRVPEMEYIFTDTGKELPETYEYLNMLEAFLGKPIVRLNAERDFDHWLKVYGGYLPSSRMRWCTRQLKLKPFEAYVGEGPVISYVGIRADEDREGYISTKPNIKAVFPFKEDGIGRADVLRLLQESGLGLPRYYEWRTRSGCFFCFFQRKNEWAGLLKHHPELFEEARAYEKTDPNTGERYTWQQGESLAELASEERLAAIRGQEARKARRNSSSLMGILGDLGEDDEDEAACLICQL